MTETPSPTLALKPWYRELSGYHWFVLAVCTLGWLFDCLDQQLFIIARASAVGDLLPRGAQLETYTTLSTSLLLIGWATGGIFFGIMGDRIGRAKTMVWTILTYSVFTGLSGFSYGIWDFILYRFLTGLGVGGQFAVGVSLVAEVMPERARAPALGMLQALSAAGNITAALIGMAANQMVTTGVLPYKAWRWMFAAGIVPALLAVVVISRLKEPERWKKAVAEGEARKKAGSLAELFGDPRWRSRAIVGVLLASAGVIGLWAIGFFSTDLTQYIFRRQYQEQARAAGEAALDRQLLGLILASPEALQQAAEGQTKIAPKDLLSLDSANKDPQVLYAAALALRKEGRTVSPQNVLSALDRAINGHPPQAVEDRRRRAEYLEGAGGGTASIEEHLGRISQREKKISGDVVWWSPITSMLFNIGAFFGIYVFSRVTQRIGRRPAFGIFFLLALVATAVQFLFIQSPSDVFWMVPLTGFFQLSVFGGYAIYFPELFPTRLRSTGTSLCYNIGRYVAASGPLLLGLLTTSVYAGLQEPLPFRYAGVTMCAIFLLGVVVLPFAPETKDQPLPE